MSLRVHLGLLAGCVAFAAGPTWAASGADLIRPDEKATLPQGPRVHGPEDSRHIITHLRALTAPLAERFKALGVRGDADWNLALDWYLAPRACYEAGIPMTLSSDHWIRDPSPLPRMPLTLFAGKELYRDLSFKQRAVSTR